MSINKETGDVIGAQRVSTPEDDLFVVRYLQFLEEQFKSDDPSSDKKRSPTDQDPYFKSPIPDSLELQDSQRIIYNEL